MPVPTFLRVAFVGLVVLACFLHTYPARGQQDVSDSLAQFEREQMEDRRKNSPAYVTTLLEMPRNHGGIPALDTTPDGGMQTPLPGGQTQPHLESTLRSVNRNCPGRPESDAA